MGGLIQLMGTCMCYMDTASATKHSIIYSGPTELTDCTHHFKSLYYFNLRYL